MVAGSSTAVLSVRPAVCTLRADLHQVDIKKLEATYPIPAGGSSLCSSSKNEKHSRAGIQPANKAALGSVRFLLSYQPCSPQTVYS